MDWKHIRQGKGQSVQEVTQEFWKKALALNVPLNTQVRSCFPRRDSQHADFRRLEGHHHHTLLTVCLLGGRYGTRGGA